MRALLCSLLLLATICLPSPCDGAGSPGERILVSAAISLKNAFEEIGRLYKAQSGDSADFNFGASGILQKQIEAGAPADVFASAGTKEMDDLLAKGLLVNETRRTIARNTLVLVVPAGQKAASVSFQDLTNPSVRRLAVGNPKTVPAGHYAEQTLRSLKIWDALQARIILAEDVRQVLDYVMRGEVDAGIVYGTDVGIAKGKAAAAARASERDHDPILYPIAVIRDTRHHEAAIRFVETVLSAEGQTILAKYGFLGGR